MANYRGTLELLRAVSVARSSNGRLETAAVTNLGRACPLSRFGFGSQ
jgi:hypothetical protein